MITFKFNSIGTCLGNLVPVLRNYEDILAASALIKNRIKILHPWVNDRITDKIFNVKYLYDREIAVEEEGNYVLISLSTAR